MSLEERLARATAKIARFVSILRSRASEAERGGRLGEATAIRAQVERLEAVADELERAVKGKS